MGDKTFYYKLKQIDYNSDFEYSDVRSATFKAIPGEISIDIYPNPANDKFNITLSSDISEYFRLSIYDHNGKLVKEGKIRNNSTFSVIELAQGNYEVLIRNREGVIKRDKLVIAR